MNLPTASSSRYSTAKAGGDVADNRYIGLDRFKVVAAMLVIAIHTGPLTSYSPYADFVLTSIVARLAVPFFFIVSGYFLFQKLTGRRSRDNKIVNRAMRRIGWMYLFSIVLYLPLNVYAGYFADHFGFVSFVKDIVFNGTFYHLWYLPALILGTYIVYFLYRTMPLKFMLVITGLLYIAGLLGDSYYGLARDNAILQTAYDQMFVWFDYTRNGFFFAPLYIALGAWTAKRAVPLKSAMTGGVLFGLSLGLLLLEGIWLNANGLPRHDSMYIFLVPAVYLLFLLLLLQKKGGEGAVLRQLSTWIYILHPIAIVLVRGAAKAIGLSSLLIENSLIHYVAVAVLSTAMSMFVVLMSRRLTKKTAKPPRAWAEIRLNHISHNVAELRSFLPPECGLMAVVKANAYGHGIVPITKHLNRIGVRHFAVADVDEGIALRKSGLKGEILVLGYTPPDRFNDLVRHRLSQTVVSADYGYVLNDCRRRIQVHVKIDTGMSRLGECCSNLEQIASIYRLRNLSVSGTFTHLAESNSMEERAIEFTNTQINRFFGVVDQLKANGIDPGTLHVQSSYGICNYTELSCGLARPGIALYGLLSDENDRVRAPINLRPALSLKARVTLVKSVDAGQSVGYGGVYRTTRRSIIATISIGYADGVPRALAERGGSVLILGQRAPVVGNLCMDQLMVDVTHIEGVQAGNIATLIGQDGEETITAGEVASRCGTITNEIVSCIGSRVKRVYIDPM